MGGKVGVVCGGWEDGLQRVVSDGIEEGLTSVLFDGSVRYVAFV